MGVCVSPSGGPHNMDCMGYRPGSTEDHMSKESLKVTDTVILCKLTLPFPLLFPGSATKQQAFQSVLPWIQGCTDFLENFDPEIRLADGQHVKHVAPASHMYSYF